MGNVVTINIKELEMSLPTPPEPVGSYVSVVQTGNLLYTSGMLPLKDGKVTYTGKVGKDITVEEGQEAAKLCCLNALSAIKKHLGSLSHIQQVIKVTGYINAEPDFADHPKVINGASDLLASTFGASGKHARAAVGMSSLPLNAAVEVDLIVEIEAEEEKAPAPPPKVL